MKTKQNKRWGLMLLSVLCAFLVWLGVVNVADPVMTETVEVQVEIINDEVLTSNSLTYEIVGKKTATISYEVKTTNAYRIHASDFRAYADMTEMWDVTGAIPIKIEVLNHSEYLESNPTSRTATIKIATEPLQKKQFTIGYTTEGTMEDDYEPGVVTLTPDTLYVEGPESQIGQISSVGIVIPVDGVSSETSGNAQICYYDANGNEIELSDRVVSDCDEVLYHMTVLKGKNLTLDFQVSGDVAEGYRFTGVECEVKSVPVVGLKSALASLHTITIPGESLNLDDAETNVVKTINLEDYLPDGVALAGTTRSEINVILTVERLQEKTYTVEIDDTSFTGASSRYTYETDPAYAQITVRALQEELDSLTIGSSDLSINVSGMAAGEHAGRIVLDLDSAYEVISTSEFKVIVTRTAENEAGSGTAASEDDPETTEISGSQTHGTRETQSGQGSQTAQGNTGSQNSQGSQNAQDTRGSQDTPGSQESEDTSIGREKNSGTDT